MVQESCGGTGVLRWYRSVAVVEERCGGASELHWYRSVAVMLLVITG